MVWVPPQPASTTFLNNTSAINGNTLTVAGGNLFNPPAPLPLPQPNYLPLSGLDRQSGLFYESLAISNSGTDPITGIRLTAVNLPDICQSNLVFLVSATGTNIYGQPYVDYNGTIAPSNSITLTLGYYSKMRQPPYGVNFIVEGGGGITMPQTNIAGVSVQLKPTSDRTDGKRAFQVNTTSGRQYVVQYSDDLVTWKQALTHFTGTGCSVLWTDIGPPDTEPMLNSRFYRAVEVP